MFRKFLKKKQYQSAFACFLLEHTDLTYREIAKISSVNISILSRIKKSKQKVNKKQQLIAGVFDTDETKSKQKVNKVEESKQKVNKKQQLIAGVFDTDETKSKQKVNAVDVYIDNIIYNIIKEEKEKKGNEDQNLLRKNIEDYLDLFRTEFMVEHSRRISPGKLGGIMQNLGELFFHYSYGVILYSLQSTTPNIIRPLTNHNYLRKVLMGNKQKKITGKIKEKTYNPGVSEYDE